MRQRVAVIDLDGTLARYDIWRGEEHFGLPILYAQDALLELKEWNWRIVIFTTRGNVGLVKKWLSQNKMPYDAVNSTSHNPPGTSHKPIADVYFDDRDAHCVGMPYDWVRVMRRVRKLYQPPLDTFIDDASLWASWSTRMMNRFRRVKQC